MTIKKAIEILVLNIKEAGRKMPADTLDALKLGVAALERLHTLRTVHKSSCGGPLPGETEES